MAATVSLVALVAFAVNCAQGEIVGSDSSTADSPDGSASDDAAIDTGTRPTSDATTSPDTGTSPQPDGGGTPDTGGGAPDATGPTDSGGATDTNAPVDSGHDTATVVDTGVDTGPIDSGHDAGSTSTGTQPLGAGCSATSDCSGALQCINGACHNTCTNPGSTCSSAQGGGQCVSQTPSDYCQISCDVASSTDCGGASCTGSKCAACVPLVSGATDCWASGGNGTSYSACTQSSSAVTNDGCSQGYNCVDITGVGVDCIQWCDLSAPVCSDSATSCQAYTTNVKIGGVSYGGCL